MVLKVVWISGTIPEYMFICLCNCLFSCISRSFNTLQFLIFILQSQSQHLLFLDLLHLFNLSLFYLLNFHFRRSSNPLNIMNKKSGLTLSSLGLFYFLSFFFLGGCCNFLSLFSSSKIRFDLFNFLLLHFFILLFLGFILSLINSSCRFYFIRLWLLNFSSFVFIGWRFMTLFCRNSSLDHFRLRFFGSSILSFFNNWFNFFSFGLLSFFSFGLLWSILSFFSNRNSLNFFSFCSFRFFSSGLLWSSLTFFDNRSSLNFFSFWLFHLLLIWLLDGYFFNLFGCNISIITNGFWWFFRIWLFLFLQFDFFWSWLFCIFGDNLSSIWRNLDFLHLRLLGFICLILFWSSSFYRCFNLRFTSFCCIFYFLCLRLFRLSKFSLFNVWSWLKVLCLGFFFHWLLNLLFSNLLLDLWWFLSFHFFSLWCFLTLGSFLMNRLVMARFFSGVFIRLFHGGWFHSGFLWCLLNLCSLWEHKERDEN